MKFNRTLAISFICIILSMYACSNNSSASIKDFILHQNEYRVGLNMYNNILIVSGNNEYTVVTEDDTIVDAVYKADYTTYGSINLKGLAKGSTTITITDNHTGETESVTVTVTDGYLTFSAGNPYIEIEADTPETEEEIRLLIEEDKIIKGGNFFTLIKRDQDNFYLFEDLQSLEEGKIEIESVFRMEISEDGSLPLIIQTEKGDHIYNISYYEEVFEEFSDLFGIDFLAKISRTENWQDRYHTSPAELGMQLTRDVTSQYNEEYPNLTNATIIIPATLIHPLTINLPEELVY